MEQGSCLGHLEWSSIPTMAQDHFQFLLSPRCRHKHGQHVTMSQTLLATISMFHLFECAGLFASNSASLFALHYISGDEILELHV